MASPATTSTAERLCQACGLCCDGVMFHTVRLQAADSARDLAALGLRLKRKRRQDHIFLQPCSAFRDMKCSIYNDRPTRCRVFECQQLQRVAAGTIKEVDALRNILDAQRRVARLDELSLRSDGRARKGPLTKRCETALAEPFDATTNPELIEQRTQLARELQELDAILDADFRLPPDDPAS